MRMQLKSYREVVPDGYRYTHHETGYTVRSWDVDSWVRQAKEHLSANGFPVPDDLQQIMEDQLCSLLGPEWCEYCDPNKPRIDTRFTWADVETGSKTLFEWAKQGLPLVSQDEAERRANICSRCYLNVRAQGCGQSCRELIRVIVGLFVNRKTSVDDRLQSCGVCKCMLKSKVHVPLTVIELHDSPSYQMSFPSFCWLRKDSDNYRP